MDDYRDVEESYTASLEKIILDAGLALPSIWGNLNKTQIKEVKKRVSAYRKKTNYE